MVPKLEVPLNNSFPSMGSARCGRHMFTSPKGIGVTEARAMADILTKEMGVREERLQLEEFHELS